MAPANFRPSEGAGVQGGSRGLLKFNLLAISPCAWTNHLRLLVGSSPYRDYADERGKVWNVLALKSLTSEGASGWIRLAGT